MPYDVYKPRGQIKSANPAAVGGPKLTYPVFGIVKDNIDPNRSGRIKVLLGDSTPSDGDNAGNWVSVSYLSSFFGRTGGSGGNAADDNGTYIDNPSSYGQWQAPPDIGTKVICIFINGDINYGFYIGGVPDPEVLHMVPAIGSSDYVVPNEGEANSYGGATRLPVTSMNTNNQDQANSREFNSSPRPVHSYTASIMQQQGILRDPVRGPISSSASREPVSRVGWGVSTPGRPIYEGGYDDSTLPNNIGPDADSTKLKVVSRRGGHTIVMDDGDIIGKDQLIRIRTALGHQILMSDDGQTLMLLHSNGQSYIELGKEGTVDIYSTNSFNVRTQGDINLHADRSINIHAAENLNIQAKNIQTNSEQATKLRSGSDFNIAATGKITGLAGGAIAWGAGGDASLVGGGQAYVNGSKVNLNSGAPSTSPDAITPIPIVAQTDTLFDKDKGFIAAPGKLLTITSRTPAHAPWANAGQGIDIKTSMDASDNLPAEASGATQATNQAAQETNPTPPAVATVASAPTTPPTSESMNKNVTAAAVAATATNAAEGPLSKATKAGTAIVKTAEGVCAAVGPMAITPSQMELGGTLKPGASTMVNALIQSGANISQAMPNSVFSSSITIEKYAQSVSAQANTLVNTFKKAQTALGAVGAITGKESPTQIAGVITSAATVGVGPTVAALHQASATFGQTGSVLSSLAKPSDLTSKFAQATDITKAFTGSSASTAGTATSLTGSLSGTLSGSVSGIANSATSIANNVAGATLGNAAQMLGNTNAALGKAKAALNIIGSGGAAAKLTETIGGLGGIQSALTAMGNVPTLTSLVDQSQGVAVSAFNAVKQSFKPLKANVPQNLTHIAKENAAKSATIAESSGSQTGTNLLNSASNIARTATGAIATVSGTINQLSSVARTAGGLVNALGSANNSISSITGSISTASATASRVLGTARSITATVNNVTSVVSTISNNVSGSPLNTTIGGVQRATNVISAFAGAGPTLASGGGLPALSNAAVIVRQGAQASTSSILATGLSNLPGGINTVANVVNRAAGVLNRIPGTGNLNGVIRDATSKVMSGLNTARSVTSALSAIGNIAGQTNKLGGLSSLASAGLPVGAIAQLQSSIASLAGGTPGGIGLPSIGFNTTNRANIASQIINVLGNPKIPTPNLVGEISDETQQTVEALFANAEAKSKQAQDNLRNQLDKITPLMKAYEDSLRKYGPDDPRTQAAYDEFNAARNSKEYTDAVNSFNKYA